MGLSSVGAITERRAAVSLNSAIILEYMATGDFFTKGLLRQNNQGSYMCGESVNAWQTIGSPNVSQKPPASSLG